MNGLQTISLDLSCTSSILQTTLQLLESEPGGAKGPAGSSSTPSRYLHALLKARDFAGSCRTEPLLRHPGPVGAGHPQRRTDAFPRGEQRWPCWATRGQRGPQRVRPVSLARGDKFSARAELNLSQRAPAPIFPAERRASRA